ncbi:MAG: ABC transporter permease [Brevibacterium aurantiacum]|uniref:ABC transporter permease n=1 Tax=Brevibacterium aurantiacum TaxID=273384 RepID=A0A2A3Z6X3_BREAU|nr:MULTISPECIES: ABC transporter permease [Brevibacterium]MDN5549496.1 ABC transporter permease [Brevibacterium sp.]AZL06545.1 ABC transporter permease [Brevibacterium aurantiacum]AZL10137.1 ABC transporter permease [Brevibacterium aurantiacum]AZL13842.1 ABC transporter permease [Brevibacterium aurantiacum]AZT94347.1 ABC transporter permease [Brevibacterium aurantiacum]
MTAQTVAAQPASQSKSLTPISWKFPIVYTILAVVSLVFFGIIGRDGETTFRIATSGDLFAIPDVVVSSTVAGLVLSLILVVMAAASIYFATKRVALDSWFPMVFGILFVVSFLAWAGGGSGGVIPLTTLLAGALALSVPLIFGAMCGLVGERSGIINIAIEGQLLAGAFLAAVVASVAKNPYAGLLAAPIAGALVAVVLTFFAVKYWVNQIIIGVVLNVLVVGVTSFLYSTVLSENPGLWNARQQLPNLPVPLLSDIPVLGRVLFDQNILVYIMYVVVIALQIFVFRSKWGLRMRAVGEHPKAADTVGIKVNFTRVRNTLMAGAIAGLGGAFFTVGSGLAFGKEMSAGQGYIALAAMILGKWNPKGALLAALLFGFSKSLGNTLQSIGTPVANELLLMLPYIVTVLAVAGFVGRVRPPAAEGVPYVK